MKKALILFFVLLSAAGIQAQVKPAKVNILIGNGNFSLNKLSINPGWKAATALNLLGVPSKEKDGFNKTYTYNDHGIVLFEAMDNSVLSGRLSEFQVYFSDPGDKTNNIIPDGFFSGRFVIEKLLLSSTVSMDQVRTALPDYKESESYMPHNFRLSKSGLYFYFQYDEIEQRLIKVSIGKDSRADTE